MRVATWNINGLGARLGFLLHWLRARQPDVVALQELKLVDEKFPRAELAELGYSAITHGQKSWNGVAVLSREPAELVQCGLPGQEELGARLLTVKASGLHVSSVYVPNGKFVGHEDFPRKLAWLDALAAHLDAGRAGAPAHVIGGDFNLCPEGLDSWNEAGLVGRIFHTRGRARALPPPPRLRVSSTSSARGTRRAAPSPGGTTAPAPSTRARACASTSCSRRRPRPSA